MLQSCFVALISSCVPSFIYSNQAIYTHMKIFTLLTPCSVQGCVQGGNNLVNTMELQRFLPCYKVVNTLYHL